MRSPNDFEAAFKIARAAQALLQIDELADLETSTRLRDESSSRAAEDLK